MLGPASRAAAQAQYLTEEQKQSLLGEIGGGLTSGLQWVGETLDKPGRALRGAISGLLGGDYGGGLLNLIPFSDTLGITDPHETIGGRDLLETAGLLGKNKPGMDLGDLAGFGAEVALDPTTWLSFGGSALTKAGTLGKNAGLLDDLTKAIPKGMGRREYLLGNTLGDLAGKTPGALDKLKAAAEGLGMNASDLEHAMTDRIGNLVGWSPFGFGEQNALFGTGKTAQKLARGMDTAENLALYGKYSPIRPLRSLFDHQVRGAMTEPGQKIGMQSTKIERESIRQAREELAPVVEALERSGVFTGENAANNAGEILRYLEESDVGTRWANVPENLKALQPHLDTLKKFGPMIRDLELASGMHSPELDDIIRYFPRERFHFPDANTAYGTGGRVLQTTTPYQKMREGHLRLHGGGTGALQELSLDPAVSGKGRMNRVKGTPLDPEEFAQIREHIVKQYVEPGKIGSMNDAENDAELDGLVRWVANLDPRHAELGIPAFEMNPAKAMLARLEHGHRASGAANAVTDLSADAARMSNSPDLTANIVPIERLLGDAGIGTEQAMQNFVRKMGDSQAVKDLSAAYNTASQKHTAAFEGLFDEYGLIAYDEAIRAGKKPAEAAKEAIEELASVRDVLPDGVFDAAKKSAKELEDLGSVDRFISRNMYVGDDVAADATRYMKSFNAPDEVKSWVKAMDKFTNLFRGSVTAAFPAFHVRNFFSGQYQNYIGGAFDPKAAGPMRYLRPIYDADNLVQGKAISDVLDIPAVKAAGITDAKKATDWVAQQAFANNLSHKSVGISGDILGDTHADLISAMPGLSPARRDLTDVKGMLGAPLPRSWKEANPLNTRGVASNEDVFAPFRAGRNTGHYVESLNRLGPFIAFLKQGMDPAEAARRVKKLQGDYSALTQFERGVSRAVPFYSFTRSTAPYMVQNLIENPGGKMAQTIRAMNDMRGRSTVTPDYIGETASIPAGTAEDGSQRYITGLGLMMEDPLSFMGNGVRGGLLEGASRLNPLIKAPLEWMTGQSFFQKGPQGGRELDDLDPTLGRTVANIKQMVTGEETDFAKPIFNSPATEFIAGNLPVSRILTTVRQMTDPRRSAVEKAINFGTGVKSSLISPAAQEAILRESVEDELKKLGGRDFEITNISNEELEKLGPVERALADLYKGALNDFRKTAKARAKARAEDRAREAVTN